MKINWLWDSVLGENEVRKILKDKNNPRFYIYASKLLSRQSDPVIVFDYIEKGLFINTWFKIRLYLEKDKWIGEDKLIFWDTIYNKLASKDKKQDYDLVKQELKEISFLLKQLRKEHGYSQKHAADKMGVIQQYISRLESGKGNYSIETLCKIATVYGKRPVIRFI